DCAGNSSSCQQTITVVDTTAPVIICPPDATVQCNPSSEPTATGSATATDNCDPAPVITHSDSTVPGTCPNTRVITRTWTATDCAGNSSSCVQTINVVDTTAPVISCPPAATVQCNTSTQPGATGRATATDNCDPNPGITFTDSTVP